MSTSHGAADAGSADGSELVCDRCDDPVPPDRVIRLSSEPCSELADRYAAVTRPHCPDCVAAVGMLAFAAETRAHAPVESG
ncbi:hypothetical protein [Natrarchaeobius oligotrophus]|uniref:Uncharacterized protein n=1 Tax=Natrarchaeobius chitinivorans TaxID=1679083 RepID=A0A3N6N0J5_NATCH|nr:hypothetical protein [Natrarchaeobius chitinivorans]RQH00977.1 hypothetical protein EA472_10190 [Natrarchaeobius chitinivorans]